MQWNLLLNIILGQEGRLSWIAEQAQKLKKTATSISECRLTRPGFAALALIVSVIVSFDTH